MSDATTSAVFKPTVSKSEAKADTTNRIALEIIHAEAAKRDAKTERLREARIAREAAESDPAPKKRKK